ncbi:MAG: hypothetical protein JJW01_01595 [Alphaproteobacteria bacterium]|nr:hypothetical protein [Rickettsiales bacterium]
MLTLVRNVKQPIIYTLCALAVFIANNIASTNIVFANTQNEAVLINKYRNWSVYKGPNNIYFIASKAEHQTGTYSKRETPFLMVTDFGNNNVEVSVYIGYTCKSGTPVSGTAYLSYTDQTNTQSFTMHSSGERAWVKGENDQDIIALFKKGAKVKIAAESYKGTNSIDTYSLNGFFDAYRTLLEARKTS